jgi:hypothetical protein
MLITPRPARRKKQQKTAQGSRVSLDKGSPHKGSARSRPSGGMPVATAHQATLTRWDMPPYSYSVGVRREAIQRAND